MAFDKDRPQARTESTFVFNAEQKHDVKASAGQQEGNDKEKAGLRTGKTRTAKAQTAKKRKADTPERPAAADWFDIDFARIAETAKPKHMMDGADEPIEPHFASRPLSAPVEKETSRGTTAANEAMAAARPIEKPEPAIAPRPKPTAKPQLIVMPEAAAASDPVMMPNLRPAKAPAPVEIDEDKESPSAAPSSPLMTSAAGTDDTSPKAKQDHSERDEAPDDIFIFEGIDDEDEDDPDDWRRMPFFSDRRLSIPASDEIHMPYDGRRIGRQSSLSSGSLWPMVTIVVIGLFAATYFWPTGKTDETSNIVENGQATIAPAPQPQVSAETIVPAGPGQMAETTPDTPIPKTRPEAEAEASTAPVPAHEPAQRMARREPAQPRHITLAPGPRPLSLSYSSRADGLTASDNGANAHEEALLSDLAVNVQRKLAVLGYADVPQSGQLDASTRSAIRAFQSNSGLPPTGEVDSQTLKLLSSMSRIQ